MTSPPSSAADTPAAGTPASGTRRHRPLALPALAVVLAVVAGVAVLAARNDPPPPPKPDIPLDTWAPYWTLGDSLPELSVRVRSMREVSPFWFNAVGVDQIVVDPNAQPAQIEEFESIARKADVAIVPSISDAMPEGGMAAILAEPAARARHVDALVAFADDGDYDGLDLDYEKFAFSDDRSTWSTTRPNWVAFIGELAGALHADGRTLTVSIPPVYDAQRNASSGFWVYDYGAIAPLVDRIRIMAYDFSVGEPGPIAPIEFVERAINGAIEATGAPDKLVLGIPAYGRNWPTFVAGDCPAEQVQGVTSVTARSVDELIERRSAVPVYVESTGEWTFEYQLEVTDGTTTCVQTRQVHYVDADGVRQRMDLAREYGLNGVALWALGFDDDAVWAQILPTVTDPASTDPAPSDPASTEPAPTDPASSDPP